MRRRAWLGDKNLLSRDNSDNLCKFHSVGDDRQSECERWHHGHARKMDGRATAHRQDYAHLAGNDIEYFRDGVGFLQHY